MKKLYLRTPLVYFVLLSMLFFFQVTSAQTITTFAGRPGYLGDGGQAKNAILANPYSITMDAAGDIYIVAAGDGHLRRIDGATQVITTYAGNTGAVYYGDNIPATEAYFSFTGGSGLAVDATGNVYIGEANSNVIRKIDVATHVITTIAGTGAAGYSGDGNAAKDALLNGPEGVALDAGGNIYFADTKNNVIRRIDAGTKKIATIAGTYQSNAYSGDGGAATAASIGVVERIAIDLQGNIYLADKQNNVIRKIDGSTKVITTIAGTGVAGYSGDGGPATAARLNGVMGLFVDATGNIFITDRVHSVVRRIDAGTHLITTIAGTGTGGYSGDGGAATSAKLDAATDVYADAAGNLYIDDYNNNRVRKVDAVTQNISTVGGNGASTPQDYVKPVESNFYFPTGIAPDQDGNLYVADFYKVRVCNIFDFIVTAAGGGSQTTFGIPATDYDILYTNSVATDLNNNLYFVDGPSHRVVKVDAESKMVSLYAGNGSTDGSGDGGPAVNAGIRPMSIATDANNNVYISDLNFRIWKVNASDGKITRVAGTGVQGFSGDGSAATDAEINNNGAGIAVDKDGNIYITDTYNYRIRMVNASTGNISTIVGTGTSASTGDNGQATDAALTMPRAVAVNDAGDIFIGDANKIRKINAGTGVITTIAGSDIAGFAGDGGPAAAALLNTVWDLKIDKKGDLYVADYGNHVVRKIAGAALPLTWLSFNGFADKSNVMLNWQTAAEINTSRFDIQRSSDGETFTTIGHVDASGNAAAITSYSYVDLNAVQNGTRLFYRLTEVDKDGKANYSRIIRVSLNTVAFSIKVSPNPVTDNINIYPNTNAGLASITLVDANGKVLQRFTQTLSAGQPVRVNAARLAKGMYYIIINTADAQARLKVVK